MRQALQTSPRCGAYSIEGLAVDLWDAANKKGRAKFLEDAEWAITYALMQGKLDAAQAANAIVRDLGTRL